MPRKRQRFLLPRRRARTSSSVEAGGIGATPINRGSFNFLRLPALIISVKRLCLAFRKVAARSAPMALRNEALMASCPFEAQRRAGVAGIGAAALKMRPACARF